MNGIIFVKIFDNFYKFLEKIIGLKKVINPKDIIFEKGYYINILNNKKKISIVKVFVIAHKGKFQLKNSNIEEEKFFKYYDLFLKNKIEIYYDFSFSIVSRSKKNGFRRIKNKSYKKIIKKY